MTQFKHSTTDWDLLRLLSVQLLLTGAWTTDAVTIGVLPLYRCLDETMTAVTQLDVAANFYAVRQLTAADSHQALELALAEDQTASLPDLDNSRVNVGPVVSFSNDQRSQRRSSRQLQ